ncbi:solute carrier family 41 member 3 [Eurytemora carolleeae]|uniref:solute carrier family 41 member 3 n=1 Tax=Eurytemora carolleeae TaxID=1294199 RepID=UPI000C76F600|nr:solute carrier family 41 member 3 [Eurytemora carolleeae]|eukprot:XP_023342805.1 solute carrier family 41 member 3-like [Eurytemora affinis]
MVGAGLVLERVQFWRVFVDIPQLFIMVPALIGLKGNLEMTLASRLSTHANLGHLDTVSQTLEMGGANLALIQLQGVVVGGLAAGIAVLMSYLTSHSIMEFSSLLVMLCSSVITASLASLSLGIVMIIVIAVSRRFGVNPDNVATPVAAALGDLVTLALLSLVSSLLRSAGYTPQLIILVLYIVIAVYCYRIADLNKDTRNILREGWTPVLCAMLISSLGGTILNRVISRFPNIALFQPVINGVAGNLVGIQASRISTELHKHSTLGTLPNEVSSCNLLNPLYTYHAGTCDKSRILTANSVAARVLLFLVLPGHLTFNLAIGLSQGFHIFSVSFLFLYMVAVLFQVCFLLYIVNILVHFLWRRAVDPDNAAIPYLTALGDLLGGALLAVVFITLDLN